MQLEDCNKRVKLVSPFEGFENHLDNGIKDLVDSISNHLNKGAKILDFGSGACLKTAVIQCMGYECSAYDDLGDDWHKKGDNVSKIINFTKKFNIDFKLATDNNLPFDKNYFDMVMILEVLEHLHESPRELLINLIELLKPNGYLMITVPNAVNIRKRLAVLRGKTNLPEYGSYYWYPGKWRGHIREYVKGDLESLAKFLSLEIVELRSFHQILYKIPTKLQSFYKLLTSIFPGWRDSWLLVVQKPLDWKPKKNLSEVEWNNIMGKVGVSRD